MYSRKILNNFGQASSHIYKVSCDELNKHNINYILIPAVMTSICQPLDISVNKIFKDNILLLFEKERLFYDNMNTNNKLTNARINLFNYINNVWEKENLITKETIVNGFKKAGIVGNFYLNKDEETIRDEMDLYMILVYTIIRKLLKIFQEKWIIDKKS